MNDEVLDSISLWWFVVVVGGWVMVVMLLHLMFCGFGFGGCGGWR